MVKKTSLSLTHYIWKKTNQVKVQFQKFFMLLTLPLFAGKFSNWVDKNNHRLFAGRQPNQRDFSILYSLPMGDFFVSSMNCLHSLKYSRGNKTPPTALHSMELLFQCSTFLTLLSKSIEEKRMFVHKRSLCGLKVTGHWR